MYCAHSDNTECTEIARHKSNFSGNTRSKRFINCTTAYVHIGTILRALTLGCDHVSPYTEITVKVTEQTATMFTALYLSAAVLRKARQMMLLSRMAMMVNCISNHSHPCNCALRYTMSACSCIEPNKVFLHGLRHSQHYFHRHNRDRAAAAASATATVAAFGLHYRLLYAADTTCS